MIGLPRIPISYTLEYMRSLENLRQEAFSTVRDAVSLVALRDIEVRLLGRSGELTAVLRDLKNVPLEERRNKGREANELRAALESAVASRRIELEAADYDTRLQSERFDITQPGRKHLRGSLHPLTLVQRDMARIFSSLGFSVVDGPEVETEWYNFDALNIPEDHPSRDMWDTFWLRQNELKVQSSKLKNGRLLLRTHTSPVQVRYM